MATRPELESEPEGPKKWQCGTPYQYPITGDGDHWEKLLKSSLEKDRAQCDSWRDEVQNLLVFAGLFSAVLTAFVVVSYPGLQPDQDEIMINLLARIATRLDNPFNSSISSAILEPINTTSLASSPTPSSIRINIFWFISLVLSLTTALIGIVTLQWLREHQQYPISLSSREKFALFTIRQNGLVAWYVPEIFSSLPLLLQLALALFFVGLIDFLLASSSSVAIPVIIFIGAPLVFLIFTTAIPVLQTLVFCLPLAGGVPQQAPYKSPQSLLFLRLLTSSRTVFTYLAYINYAMYYLLIIPSRLYRYMKPRHGVSNADGKDTSLYSLQDNVGLMFSILRRTTWLFFDKQWLFLRDAYAKSIFDRQPWMTSSNFYALDSATIPLYDLTSGISDAIVDSGLFSPAILSLGYLCAQELSPCINGDEASASLNHSARMEYNRYLQNLLNWGNLARPSPTFSSLVPDPPIEFVEDETNFIFLSKYHNALSPSMLQHFAELHIRIANYLYPSNTLRSIRNLFPDIPIYPDIQFSYYYKVSLHRNYSPVFEEAISEQFSSIVKTYFDAITDPSIEYDTLSMSAYSQEIGSIFEYAAIAQSAKGVSSMLEFISSSMKHNMEGVLNERSDFLFYLSSFYTCTLCLWLLVYQLDPENNVVAPVLLVLCQYLDTRGRPNGNLCQCLGIPDTSYWQEFLNGASEQPRGSRSKINYIAPIEESDANTIQHAEPLHYTGEHSQSDISKMNPGILFRCQYPASFVQWLKKPSQCFALLD